MRLVNCQSRIAGDANGEANSQIVLQSQVAEHQPVGIGTVKPLRWQQSPCSEDDHAPPAHCLKLGVVLGKKKKEKLSRFQAKGK